MGRGAEGGEKAGLEKLLHWRIADREATAERRRDSCKAVAGPAGMTETGQLLQEAQ